MSRHNMVAVAIAILIVICGLLFAWHTRQTVKRTLREEIGQAAENDPAADQPAVSADETEPVEGFGVEVTQSMMWRIDLADTLFHLWFIWIPLTFAICFGVAWLTKRCFTS